MFDRAVTLFEIMGFRIRVDPSWIFIAALVVWSLATGYFPSVLPELDRGGHILVSIFAMLGLFFCLILHELAHALVARRFGLAIGGITLFLFGGVAELEQEPADPGSEFWIAVAGPAMSFALGGAAFLATTISAAGGAEILAAFFQYMMLVNLVLAVFNMLPAFPLDGGRVLRAALWARSGDVVEATRIASGAGSILAYALMALGLLGLFQGASLGALWQILIGLFLLTAARGTYEQVLTRHALRGLTADALMTAEPYVAQPDLTLAELAERVMLRHGITFVPVVEGDTLIGYIDTRVLKGIDRENWNETHVGDVFVALEPAFIARPADPAERLMRRMATTGQRKLLIVDKGHLRGVLTLSDLLHHISVLQALGGPRPSLRD